MEILLALTCVASPTATIGVAPTVDVAPTIDVAPATSSVWLDGHRGVLDASAEPPQLRLLALGHNHLDVAIEAIEIGVLFAAEAKTLGTADLARLYQPEEALKRDSARGVDGSTMGEARIGASRQWVDVRIEPGAEAVIALSLTPQSNDPEPATWVTHVLGYRLAEVNTDVLFGLLHTDVFSDEVAAVHTLGLTDASRKSQVRSRFGQQTDLITGLITAATAKPKADPDFQDALDRVFAIRALGVLGGNEARTALESLLASSVLDPLDEPLLVVSIARLRNTPLEAPLAFAVPVQARRMRDVVTAALDDAAGRQPAATPAADETDSHSTQLNDTAPGPSGVPVPDVGSSESGPTDGHSRLGNLAFGALALAIVLLAVAVFNRRRKG